jgi:hypothetical protein
MSVRFRLPAVSAVLGLWLVAALGTGAHALPYYLTIQSIQVCMDNGTTCANPTREVFNTATSTIWAQAGVEVRFDEWTVLNSTQFYHLQTGTEFAMMFNAPGVKSSSFRTLNVFFVDDINSSSSYFGEAFVGQSGIAIGSSAVLATNRMDTLAHEIGHNLGLRHDDHGANVAQNLMADGGLRAVPTTVDDIAPGGAGLDFLNETQISTVLTSIFVRNNPNAEPASPPSPDPPTAPETSIPTPGGLAPVAAGALVFAALGRRRREITMPL